jgi:hypothetical protein
MGRRNRKRLERIRAGVEIPVRPVPSMHPGQALRRSFVDPSAPLRAEGSGEGATQGTTEHTCAECGGDTHPAGYVVGNWRMVTGAASGRPTWLLFPEGVDPECPCCGCTWENQDDETSERCRGCGCCWFEGKIVSVGAPSRIGKVR